MGVEGVILAAGLSSRAENYKMALDLGGETVIERCVKGMYSSCSRIIVVVGHKAEIIKEILNKYSKVELIYNKEYQQGMFTSVKEGLKRVKEDRFFFTPGDYPLISTEVYDKMLQIGGDIIIPTYKGRKGHPILMKKSTADEIFIRKELTNLREFINYKGFTAVQVEDGGILMDIDTVEDYLKAKDTFIERGVKLEYK
jgi:molybdenum cofactor cytidylyltransferase